MKKIAILLFVILLFIPTGCSKTKEPEVIKEPLVLSVNKNDFYPDETINYNVTGYQGYEDGYLVLTENYLSNNLLDENVYKIGFYTFSSSRGTIDLSTIEKLNEEVYWLVVYDGEKICDMQKINVKQPDKIVFDGVSGQYVQVKSLGYDFNVSLMGNMHNINGYTFYLDEWISVNITHNVPENICERIAIYCVEYEDPSSIKGKYNVGEYVFAHIMTNTQGENFVDYVFGEKHNPGSYALVFSYNGEVFGFMKIDILQQLAQNQGNDEFTNSLDYWSRKTGESIASFYINTDSAGYIYFCVDGMNFYQWLASEMNVDNWIISDENMVSNDGINMVVLSNEGLKEVIKNGSVYKTIIKAGTIYNIKVNNFGVDQILAKGIGTFVLAKELKDKDAVLNVGYQSIFADVSYQMYQSYIDYYNCLDLYDSITTLENGYSFNMKSMKIIVEYNKDLGELTVSWWSRV